MYGAIRLFDKETFVYLLVCLLGVRAVSLRKSAGAEIWRMRIRSPSSSYGMASLAKDPVCAKPCEGFKAWSDLHIEKQTQTFSGGVKVEWRGTYNLTAKFPIMVKSFFRKKENGWFNDLQVKIAFLHHGKSFKLFLIYGKWRKKWVFVFNQCQPLYLLNVSLSAAKCRWICIKVCSHTVLVTYWLNLFFNLTYFPHMKHFGSGSRQVVIKHLFLLLFELKIPLIKMIWK